MSCRGVKCYGTFKKNEEAFMQKVLWIITIIFSILGALVFVGTVASSNGAAPQIAAGAAMALCLAAIPYVISRAVSEIKK